MLMPRLCYHFSVALLAVLITGATSCDHNAPAPAHVPDKEQLIEANRKRASREQDLLDAWVERSGWDMTKTSTGLRYEVYYTAHGDSARGAEVVGITYTSFLLDSTEVVSTGRKVHQFMVGHDDVISGLHEVVTLLAVGDSARIIFPSYLAYGLTGNHPTIPPNAPLLYDLCLVHIR